MKKILVTGGLGFIGSNLVRCLMNETDYEVINLDKQTYAGNPENLKDIEGNSRYKWVKEDICNQDVVKELMSKVDAVLHLAAESHVDRSLQDPDTFLKTNILGTHNLLYHAHQCGIEKFVHVSTDEVYGSVEKPSLETDILNPSSPYSSSKASSDLVALSYEHTFDLPVVVTRCSNNFGPYQHIEKAIPLLITNASMDKPFPLYGDGKQVRDWLYVVDHARALIFLLENGEKGEIYNIGGTCSLDNKTLIYKILDLMGKPHSLIEHVQDRLGHDRKYDLDCSKLSKLGWSPQYAFDDAIQNTIEWYLENQDWWKKTRSQEEFENYFDQQYSERLKK